MISLKDYNITFVELQELTKLSRPTLYKYLEYYNFKKYSLIRQDCLTLFDFLSKNTQATKFEIYSFYMTDCISGVEKVENIINYLKQHCTLDEQKDIVDQIEKGW